MVVTRPRVSGAATATTGMAWSSAHWLSLASAILRLVTPNTTIAVAIAAAARPATRNPLRETPGSIFWGSVICGSLDSSGDIRHSGRFHGALAVVFVQHAENHRHE